MKKIFFILFYLFIFVFFCFSDNTNDENENIVKFRGSLSVPLAYYFPNDPLNVNNHISLINYDYYYDFTDYGDEDYENHDKNDPGIKIKAVPYMIESQIESTFSIIYPTAGLCSKMK